MQSRSVHKILESNINDAIHGLVEWGPYKIGYFLARSIAKETSNEDCVFLFSDDSHCVLGVSDGAGGHPKGDEASLNACTQIKKSFESNEQPLIDSIFLANEKVLDLKAGAHCTLCLCDFSEDYMQAYSVGDSEVIGWNHLGTEIYSNIPDSSTGHSIEAGHISQEESLSDPDRYIVNNMMGDKTIRVEVTSKIETKKGHTYLIGSDGLFDNFSHLKLYDLVGEGNFEESFNDLVLKCSEQNQEIFKKYDDISFLLIRKIKA